MAEKEGKPDRDTERSYPLSQFIAKLRRLADCLERGVPFKIQVAGERITVPVDAAIGIEHEREGGKVELEFQLSWREG
ncbi:amphi-Trp domain-containing protein [bacterium]|nr:amphi-Trp domain-containing protein [candidate division CSSED10-310 bacterium]